MRKMSRKLGFLRAAALCPSILNMYVDRYSTGFLLKDIFAGIKIFLILSPIAFSLAFFCGVSPIQGIMSCATAAFVSAIFGGCKYQIASVALPVCVLTFEIISKYQYRGLLYTAIFAALILVLFGLLRVSEVLKHISYSFISAITVYVVLSIIINQTQYILGIGSIQSSQSLLENFSLFKGSLENLTSDGLLTAAIFIAPLIVLKIFFKGFFPFFLYLVFGCAFAYANSFGTIPGLFEIKTIGREIIGGQATDTIATISRAIPSQTFLANALNYAFIIALIIGSESCFCANVASSVTGDKRGQINAELVSTGLSNFVSVALGGLFVSPNINFSLKNIENKAKTVISSVVVAILSYLFILYSETILNFVPIFCISGILIVYALSELFNKRISQYLNLKSSESYIFISTIVIAIYFGFIPATIVGFTMSSIFFAKRMVRIKDANVHTTQDHDSGAIEFMTNKNGFSDSMKIPAHILDKIEVIQISNILFLNIAKVVDEALQAKGKYPSVLIIYFKNIPYIDGDAFNYLKQLVRSATSHGAIVMVSGTNGLLLDILQQRAEKEGSGDTFGYITPNFREAIDQTIRRLEGKI